jgi:hypothetical protein
VRYVQALVVVVAIIIAYTAFFGAPSSGCFVHPSQTIEDMLRSSPDGSNATPIGFTIVQGAVRWSSTSVTRVFLLPSRQARSFPVVYGGYQSTGRCRVKDAEGKWWIAALQKGGYLQYVAEEDVTTK